MKMKKVISAAVVTLAIAVVSAVPITTQAATSITATTKATHAKVASSYGHLLRWFAGLGLVLSE